eukprot:scaffold8551_cov132-Isochrysis_galbana.AAC.11
MFSPSVVIWMCAGHPRAGGSSAISPLLVRDLKVVNYYHSKRLSTTTPFGIKTKRSERRAIQRLKDRRVYASAPRMPRHAHNGIASQDTPLVCLSSQSFINPLRKPPPAKRKPEGSKSPPEHAIRHNNFRSSSRSLTFTEI